MLQSPDPENKVVALTIINQFDFKPNITKVLLLRKHSQCSDVEWQEHAPEINKQMHDLNKGNYIDLNRHLTYKMILEAITKLKVGTADFEFFCKDFGDHLLRTVWQAGYDEVESLSVKVKYKADE